MDFEPSDRCKAIQTQLERFMDEYIYPNERTYQEQTEAADDPHAEPAVMKEIRAKAKAIGLWNLFLPDAEYGAGLSNLDYTPLCEVMGRSRSPRAPSTARRPTPATPRSSPSSERPSRRSAGSNRCSKARSARASR